MPTAADNIDRAILQLTERLTEITAELAVTVADQGRTIHLQEAQDSIVESLQKLQELKQQAGGTFLIKSSGRPG